MERLFYDRVNAETGEVQTAIDVWINAASHIFFTFGLAEGILITYASYNPPREEERSRRRREEGETRRRRGDGGGTRRRREEGREEGRVGSMEMMGRRV
eukprot:750795-Hanusia_phi.AAC.3